MKINNISFILICIITLFFIFIIYNGLEKYDGFSVNDVFTNNNKIPNIIHFCFLNKALAEVKIENIAPVVNDNATPSLSDNNQDKAVIDSKFDSSINDLYPEASKMA
jgi:hypothetical protein